MEQRSSTAMHSAGSNMKKEHGPETGAGKIKLVWVYCKKPGHIWPKCFLLYSKSTYSKAAALVKTLPVPITCNVGKTDLHVDIYTPFLMKGKVSVAGGVNVSVTVLRDAAASSSII